MNRKRPIDESSNDSTKKAKCDDPESEWVIERIFLSLMMISSYAYHILYQNPSEYMTNKEHQQLNRLIIILHEMRETFGNVNLFDCNSVDDFKEQVGAKYTVYELAIKMKILFAKIGSNAESIKNLISNEEYVSYIDYIFNYGIMDKNCGYLNHEQHKENLSNFIGKSAKYNIITLQL